LSENRRHQKRSSCLPNRMREYTQTATRRALKIIDIDNNSPFDRSRASATKRVDRPRTILYWYKMLRLWRDSSTPVRVVIDINYTVRLEKRSSSPRRWSLARTSLCLLYKNNIIIHRLIASNRIIIMIMMIMMMMTMMMMIIMIFPSHPRAAMSFI